MYKVFFKDRIVFFINEASIKIGDEEAIYYKYKSMHSLRVVLTNYYHQEFIKELYLINDDTEKMWEDFKSAFKLIKAAGGLVKNEKSELLFIKRDGYWDLPKGKAEKKEKPEETALREVKEECGLKKLKLKSHITTTYHTYFLEDQFILKETEWFEMESVSSEKLTPQKKEGISNVIWVEQENLGYLTGKTYGSIIEVLKVSNLLILS